MFKYGFEVMQVGSLYPGYNGFMSLSSEYFLYFFEDKITGKLEDPNSSIPAWRYEVGKTISSIHYKNGFMHNNLGPAKFVFTGSRDNPENAIHEFWYEGVQYPSYQDILEISSTIVGLKMDYLNDGLHFQKSWFNHETMIFYIETRLIESNELDSLDDKPSCIQYNMTDNNKKEFWHKNNLLHRNGDLPASIDENYHIWYQNGNIHRENKPAKIGKNYCCWYSNGEKHNLNGAAEQSERFYHYYVDGNFCFLNEEEKTNTGFPPDSLSGIEFFHQAVEDYKLIHKI